MKDFHEAFLTVSVPTNLAGVYKKAIETENKERFVRHDNEQGYKLVWSGNHVHVDIDNGFTGATLRIGLISHTLPNLQEMVRWYEANGATVVYTSWERK